MEKNTQPHTPEQKPKSSEAAFLALMSAVNLTGAATSGILTLNSLGQLERLEETAASTSDTETSVAAIQATSLEQVEVAASATLTIGLCIAGLALAGRAIVRRRASGVM